MFKKKNRRDKKSDKIDSIKIHAEGEPKYAGLVSLYGPDIISRLEPKQVLPYMASIDHAQREKIKKLGEIDRAIATKELLDTIKQSRDKGIWREFMTALERTKYVALRQKLHGDVIHDDTFERRYIELMSPQLRQIIIPSHITPALLSCDVLIQEDNEEIQCELNNRGSIAATDLLLKRVSGKHPKWYTELMTALFTSGMRDAGRVLADGFNQSPEISKPTVSTIMHHPKTGIFKKKLCSIDPKPTNAGNQPTIHEAQNYLTPTYRKRDYEEHVYDEVSDEEDPDDREVKVPDTETIYVYAKEDNDAIYQGHRSLQKGDMIRVIKPRDGEEDEKYYRCADKEGQLIPKMCVEDIEVPKRKIPTHTSMADTQTSEKVPMTLINGLSDFLKKKTSDHKIEQHEKVPNVQRGRREDCMKQDWLVPENSGNKYLALDRTLMGEILEPYDTVPQYVPPLDPMSILKEEPDTKVKVKKETIYVYAVEDNASIYQAQLSFKKGDVIRVIKPKDGEEDEEYYRSADEEGQLIPKVCVEDLEIPKRKGRRQKTSTTLDNGSSATDTKMLVTLLSDLLKIQSLDHKLMQHEKVPKEARVEEDEDDSETTN